MDILIGKSRNPWLGLKAYSEDETLYGRDEEIRSLSQYVMCDKETVLYGRSGIGKSSIINAGVIPVARRRDVTPVYIRLEHGAGSDTYIGQIRNAITGAGVAIAPVRPAHDAPRGELLWELFHGNRFLDGKGQRVKLLIIFDQFEEMFTLQRNERVKRTFFEQLADLPGNVRPAVLEASINLTTPAGGPPTVNEPNHVAGEDLFNLDLDDFDIELPSDEGGNYVDDNEYHMVFTLREDFLSDFEYYTAKIPPLKNHRFGLRPINEEQAADIICKPRPGLVSIDVAKLIIEKVTGRTDFELDDMPEIEVNSAMLSLYMSRLYEKKRGADVITAGLVEEKGGEIIRDFYADSIQSVPDGVMERIEDELTNEEGRRENKSYAILCATVGQEYVDQLVRCQLLSRFQYAGDNRVEFIHDILCPVIRKRREQRAEKRKQEKERQRQEEANCRLIAEKEELARQARLSRRQGFRIMGISATIVAALALIICYFYFTGTYQYSACYAQFKRIYGWPVGVGSKLTDSERKTTPLYYRLSRTGVSETTFIEKVKRLGNALLGNVGTFTDVEVLSSNPRLPLMPRVNTPEVDAGNADDRQDVAAMAYYEKLKRIKTIHFVGNEDGTIGREVVSDENGRVLFVTSYFLLQSAGEGRNAAPKEAWLHFLTAQGQAMKVRDNGVDRMKVAWDDEGRLTSMMYYDEQRACHPITNGIYGHAMRYCKDQTTVRYLVDEYGQPLREGPSYNTLATRSSDDGQRTDVVYAHERTIPDTISLMTLKEVLTTPAPGPEGYTRKVSIGRGLSQRDSLYVGLPCVALRTTQYDDRGNATLVTTESTGAQASTLFFASCSPYQTLRGYDRRTGYQVSEEHIDREGNPFAIEGISKREWSYDKRGMLTKEKRYTPTRCVYSFEKTINGGVTTETLDDAINHTYTMRVDTIKGDHTWVTAYYGRGNRPVLHTEYDEDIYDIICFHRIKRDTLGEGVVKTYLYGTPDTPDLKYYCKERKADADDHTLSFRTYDDKGRIQTSMMYFLQDGQRIARAAMGIDGTPVRCPNWEDKGLSYYKLYQATDVDNEFTSLRPVNEFGDLSVLGLGDRSLSLKYTNLKGSKALHQGHVYRIRNTYWERAISPDNSGISQASMPYLHLLTKDSRLYRSGLRDGDRIISLGPWHWGDTNEALAVAWRAMEKQGADLVILRPEGASFQTLTTSLPPGRQPAVVQEEYHLIRLTDGEYAQINKYLHQKP